MACLRGYAYQLYASALAWLALGPDERLHLEVAEDYAVASRSAMQAVQVKDLAPGRTLTVRDEGVRRAIDAFVDLVDRNPNRAVRFRFLTTAEVGVERALEDRIEGEATLAYWRRAAAGADVAPLRAVLARLDLKPRTQAFIAACDDEALRLRFLQRIHWDGGQCDLTGLRHELEGTVAALGERDALPYSGAELRLANAVLLEAVLETVLQPHDRVLTPRSRLDALEGVTHTSVPRRELAALLRVQAGRAPAPPAPFRAESDTPLPRLLAQRTAHVDALLQRVRAEGLVLVNGATGMGKTLLARLAARASGKAWVVADFLGLNPEQAGERLEALLGAAATAGFDGLILDDLNEIEDPGVLRRLAQLRSALGRWDRLCIATVYRAPSARTRSELGVTPDAVQAAVDLAPEEVVSLVRQAGGDPRRWTTPILRATAFGHPQLVQATIADLATRSWPEDELQRLADLDTSGLDLAAQRTAARRRLVETAPEAARALLYRLSLLIGAFGRDLVAAVGQAPPPIGSPGEHLDRLIGPWLDPVGPDLLRISPLLSDAGAQILGRPEQVAVHQAAAEHLLPWTGPLDVGGADSGLLHALAAKAEGPLTRLATAVVSADQANLARLSPWLTTLRVLRTDQPIFPERPTVSRLLRLAQVLVDAEAEHVPKPEEKWRALASEIAEEADQRSRDRFELMALTKALLCRRMASLPDWPDLLLRLDALSTRYDDMAALMAAVKSADEALRHPLGVYFVNLCMGLDGVAALASVFRRLEELGPARRERLLGHLRSAPFDVAHIVNHPWLAEHAAGTLEGRTAAAVYAELAALAMQWGEREIAMRCHIACSIMLDEYADDEAAALAALESAEADCGLDPAIARARAKVAYRRSRHADALALLREVAAGGGGADSIEQAFLYREAAISAAEVGELEESLRWFETAQAAARASRSPTMRPMVIGLAADVALGHARCGWMEPALRGLAAAVLEARDLDPESSLKAAYCHKALGHACLWLNGQVTGEPWDANGGPPVAPPGFCSNPEPQEDIRTLPQASTAGSLYLLAMADARLGDALGLEAALRTELGERHIFTLEVALRRARLEYALLNLAQDDLPERLSLALEGMVLTAFQIQSGQSRQEGVAIVAGAFPRAGSEVRQGPSAAAFVDDAVFALHLANDLRGAQVQDRLEVLVENLSRDGYPRPTFPDPDASSRRAVFQAAWREVREGEPAARDLFLGCLRLLEWARGSIFGGLLLPELGHWASGPWTRVVRDQRFQLLTPAVTAPAIEAAIAGADDHDRFAAILRAARPAFRIDLDAGLGAMLAPRRRPPQESL